MGKFEINGGGETLAQVVRRAKRQPLLITENGEPQVAVVGMDFYKAAAAIIERREDEEDIGLYEKHKDEECEDYEAVKTEFKRDGLL